jgi:hypothetical protein
LNFTNKTGYEIVHSGFSFEFLYNPHFNSCSVLKYIPARVTCQEFLRMILMLQPGKSLKTKGGMLPDTQENRSRLSYYIIQAGATNNAQDRKIPNKAAKSIIIILINSFQESH